MSRVSYFIEVLSRYEDVISVLIQRNPSLVASTWGFTKFAIQSVVRPYYLFSLYGAPGLVLYVFGSRTTWRTEAHVLGKVDDGDSLNFKKSVQDECTMISVAAAIVAQIAITGFSLENLSRTHWVARAFFLFSVISSLMAVYYATTQQRIMGRLLRPAQVRGWIRGRLPPRQNHPIWKIKPSGHTRTDPEDYRSTSLDPRSVAADVMAKCFTPSVVSVITMSASQLLLSSSLFSLLLGIGVYFGFTWRRNLDADAGPHDDRNVMIIYLVSVTVCLIVYSVSRLIQDDDTRPEEMIIMDYMQEYMKEYPEVVNQWSPNFSEYRQPEAHTEDHHVQV